MIWRNFLLVRDNFSFSTLCIQYCHSRGHRFCAKLSSNQNFTKELYCKLIWRKKNLRDSELLVFRTLLKLLPATVFSQKFRQINVSLKNVNMYWFDGKNLCGTQRGNYGNSLSRIFDKYSVKVTVLLNKLLKSWFDEKKIWWERNSRFSTVCSTVCEKTRNSLTTAWKSAKKRDHTQNFFSWNQL